MTTRIFVYGTLLTGEENHGLLAGARCAGLARTRAAFVMVDLGGHPAVVPPARLPRAAGDAGAVVGEVWEVEARTLASLDRLEDHPRWYRREEVALEDGTRAEIYVLAVDPGAAPVVRSRDWRKQ